MRLPSKIFSYKESILSKYPLVLSILNERPVSVRELFMEIKSSTEDVGEFLEIIDCLYALGAIDYDEETRTLKNVSRNQM